MRTCPAPGWGISRSTMSKSAFGLEICATFMVTTPVFVATFTAAMLPPGNPRFKVEERCGPFMRWPRLCFYMPKTRADRSHGPCPVSTFCKTDKVMARRAVKGHESLVMNQTIHEPNDAHRAPD